MKPQLLIAWATSLVALSSTGSAVAADAYPSKTITIICPCVAGESQDTVARLIATSLAQRLGVPAVVDNKAGASGQIGLTAVSRAQPDGYTLGLGMVTNLALAQSTYKHLPYDPLKDFTPVAVAAGNYLVVVARPDSPFKTIPEMVAWAKANDGKLQLGTISVGGLPHMSFELLAKMAGIKFTNVPYKGSGGTITDLLGGRLDLAMPSYSSVAPLIENGKLRVLGSTYPTRDPAVPNLPTIGESIKGYSSLGWLGIVAPAGTPKAIVDKLNAEINFAVNQPKTQQTFPTLGLIPMTESPEYFAKLIKSDDEKFAKLVKDIGYEPQ